MSKPMTITLPPRLRAALTAEAEREGMTDQDWLKAMLWAGLKSDSGVVLKLRAVPVSDGHPELPLGDLQP